MIKCRMFANHVPLCYSYVHFVIIVSIITDYYTGIHKFILKFLVDVITEIQNEGVLPLHNYHGETNWNFFFLMCNFPQKYSQIQILSPTSTNIAMEDLITFHTRQTSYKHQHKIKRTSDKQCSTNHHTENNRGCSFNSIKPSCSRRISSSCSTSLLLFV